MDKWFIIGKDADFDTAYRSFELGNFAEAASEFELCLMKCLDPGVRRLATHFLVRALRELVNAEIERADYALGLQIIARALELRPTYPDLHFLEAQIHFLDRNFEKAIDSISNALEIHPDYPQANALFAEVFVAQGRDADAHRFLGSPPDLDKAINMLKAQKVDVSEFLEDAALSMKQSQWPEAEKFYRDALALAPSYADVHAQLAQALVEQEMLEEAESELVLAIDINPKFADAWASLGVVYRRLQRNEEAKMAFGRACQNDPLHPIASRELERLAR